MNIATFGKTQLRNCFLKIAPVLAALILSVGIAAAQTVATPTFSPWSGTYTSSQTVTISTTTSGASIRYTTDGSTPSETAGTLYSNPISVNSTTTLIAIAYASGMTDSALATSAYTITPNSAQFLALDNATQGSWKGVYGSQGYNVIEDDVSYPSYVTVTPSGASSYVWSSSLSELRALQQVGSTTERIAATWYNSGSFSLDVNFGDTSVHQVAMYFLDWDGGRTQTVSILDATTNDVLDTRYLTNFYNGQYLVWNLTGHVTVQFTQTGSWNAVVAGLFFDPQTPVGAPTFSPIPGTYTSSETVSMVTPTVGASIRYTTDGSTPSETAGTPYSGPVTVSATTTIKAIAYASEKPDSVVVSAAYTIAESNWYSAYWRDRKAITIDHTKVSGSANLSNFPVLISVTDANLATVANGGSVALPDGSDILFTASDGVTKLNHQVESYNATTGQLIAWVQVPIVSPTGDAVIFIYYGNPSASNQQNPTGVWDSNFQEVLHLDESSGTTLFDSTSNGNNGTKVSATSPAPTSSGQIAGAQSFNGTSDYAVLPPAMTNGVTTFSVSFWTQTTDTGSNGTYWNQPQFVGDASNGSSSGDFGLVTNSGDLGMWSGLNSGGDEALVTNSVINDNNWHHIAAVNDGTFIWLYLDGQYTNQNLASGLGLDSLGWYLGAQHYLSGTAANFFHQGIIDEFRFSNSARSAGWVGTEYNNQNSPSTFYSIGSQQGSGLPPPAAMPTFSPVAGTYTSSQTVTISSTTSGVSIRYTIDGSTPSETAGTLYSGPITVSSTTTLNAIAYESGMTDSTVASATYVITGTTWYSPYWGERKAIIIDHTKVAGSSSLTNFPVLISMTDGNLATVANGGNVALPDGSDILFTSADGATKLNHQIESYNAGTGQLIAWVQVPAVSPTTATVIYIYYGSASASNQQNPTGVWDSNYAGVWHFASPTTLSPQDSTNNGNNGTINGSPSVIGGQIGWAANFAGTTDDLAIQSIPLGGADYTISAWFNMPFPDTGSWNTLTRGLNTDHQVLVDEGNWHLGSYGNQDGGFWDSGFNVSTLSNGWHYLVADGHQGTTLFYVDGGLVGSIPFQSTSDISFLGNYQGGGQQFGGTDELRISTGIARSASWIATEFNNQGSPSTFYSVGSQQGSTLPPPVIPPAFSPPAETYATAQTVTMSTTTSGASIRYTTDGSTPSETAGTLYTGPIAVSSTTTINAIAYESGMTDSQVASATYTIAGSNWYSTSWSDRKAITINHTKVAGASSLTNFPVLISMTDANLATVANGGNVALPDGSDVLFTAVDGTTKLNHEIESYNPSTGQLIAWVQVSTVSPAGDAVIYIYYGNASASNQQNPAGVWDSNYSGVWHFPSSTTLGLQDSTSNGNNGSPVNGPLAASGDIAGAVQFNGSSSYVNVGSFNETGDLTISAWVNTNYMSQNTNSDDQAIVGKSLWDGDASGDFVLKIGKTSVDNGIFFNRVGSSGAELQYDSSLSTGTWYYVVATYAAASNTGTIYVNGASGASGNLGTAANTNSHSVLIGMQEINLHEPFSGVIDEVRISSTPRSAGWIATEYNNQSSPSTFYSVGSQQGSGSPPQVAAPAFTPGAGTYASTQTVTISSGTSGASIRYTNDGGTPSETAGTPYSGPITVSSTTTINAIAYESGMTDSSVASATFTIMGSAPPSISGISPAAGPVGTLVTINGSNFGASQGSSTVTFNGTGAVTVLSWSASSITVAVPAGATTGNVVVTVSGVASSGTSFTVSVSFVGTTGVMGVQRSSQTATRLSNGNVLVAGGINTSGVLGSAELYNPSSQTFSPAGSMSSQRWMHSATLLNDGTVLIAGGSSATTGTTLNSAEIYDPVAGTFTLLSNTLNTARAGQTATLLNNGQVLLIGGIDPTAGIIQDAELYDPPTQTFIDLGDTTTPRYGHTATMLQNGQVLIAGGETDPTPTGALSTAELFDPVAQVFNPVLVPMTSAREGHAAVLLNNGQVLITGGDYPGSGSLNSAEIYNPALGIFTQLTATMTAPRISHTMTLLNGGGVLIAGGATDSTGGSTVLNTTELFNPSNQTFVAAGAMTSVREHDSASLLNDGTVLLAGGTDGTNIFNSAELYMPSQLTGLVSIAVTPASPSIGVGAQQSFTATGTFSDSSTQTLASVLWSSSSTTVAPVSGDSTDAGVATAAAQGTTTIAASAVSVTGSTTLTVTAATLSSITLSPQDSVIALGGTLQFAATGNYSDGSTQDLTSSATWGSSSSTVATISSGGLATGLLQGTASIQASYGSLSATTNLSVGTPALVSITINPTTATVAMGTNQQYQVLGTYSNGSTQDVTTFMDWSSSTTSVANVGITGLATTVGQGASTITATFESLSVSSSLTVNPPVLASIAVSPDAASIPNGGSQQLTATGTYTDGSTQDLTSSSAWVSSNTAAITVNSSGLATAVGTGNSTITATTGSTVGTTVLIVTSPTTGASLNTSRYQHSAITLNNGQILIAGGVSCPTSGSCSYLNSAEIYDPPSDTFTNTGSLATARSAPAVLLNTGKVLVAGGYTCDTSGNCASLSSVELYDPNAGTFSSAGTMTQARSGHTMTLLSNGSVLIAGGENCTAATSCTATLTAEIYNPTAGTFTATGNTMGYARFNASAVALNSGLVMIVGGFDGTNLPNYPEMYNPATNEFTFTTPHMLTARFSATANLLNSGQVLIAGGSTCAPPGCPTNAAEIYDPVANSFTSVSGGMTISRFSQSATLITNSQVYIAGGFSSCGSSCTSEASTEVFDPVAGSFSSGQPVANALSGQTGTLVANGSALLVGGINDGVTLSGDQWYQPTTLTPAGLVSIAVTPASAFLTPGQTRQFVATGTFSDSSTQTLQSVIWTSSSPSAALVSNSPGSAGLVTALVAGTSEITATAGDVGSSASLGVATLVSIAISPANQSLSQDSNQQFTASGTFSDGSTHDVTASVAWSSSNSSLVSIASGGLAATGVTAGTATITATVGMISGNTSITVQPLPATPSVISVSPSTGTAGTQVTISGSGFGTTQGTGTVWLGTNPASVTNWASTQIVATVAAGSRSGNAQVQQSGSWSNTIGFTVAGNPTISNVTPIIGVTGTPVTITGSGFGATQGSGQVWLGTMNGQVEMWSDTQIVAAVEIGSGSGIARVLQNGVMSNGIAFTVNTPRITTISSNSGAVGASVTINGNGFGASQGSAVVWLGSMAGQVTSWTNTQIVATVAPGSVSGVAWVEQNDQWSNMVSFTVPGGSVTLVPNVINMLVGDTHTIEAMNSSGQSVTGLTWTSSNTNVVTLSTDNPPILRAAGVGRSTIAAGGASADVTVSAVSGLTGGLPLGTVLCSNPGDGSGVASIVPAVPSATGVADVFAFQNDGTVSAVASDCTTAWTAQATQANAVPDFNGGLVVVNYGSSGGYQTIASIVDLDGITGQPDSTYTPSDAVSGGSVLVHTDGTIFSVQASTDNPSSAISVVGIDPTSGSQKFSVALPEQTDLMVFSLDRIAGDPIIAGDGYAYLPYWYSESYFPNPGGVWHLMLMRVNSSGESDNIHIQDFPEPPNQGLLYSGQLVIEASLITNADTGVLLTYAALPQLLLLARPAQPKPRDVPPPIYATYGMAIVSGTSVNAINTALPNQVGILVPGVQAQDGSFVGSYQDGSGQTDMVAFDASGNVRWTVPNETPQIATDDGGVIGESGITYDANGTATGQIDNALTRSWFGYAYQVGSVEQVLKHAQYVAGGYWPFKSANLSENSTAVLNQWFPPLKSCVNNSGQCVGPLQPGDFIWNAEQDLVRQLQQVTASVAPPQQQQCATLIQTMLNGMPSGDSQGRPITIKSFVSYVLLNPSFYDGSVSTLGVGYALCGEHFPRVNCGKNPATTTPKVWQVFADASSGTTAITVTPSEPFKSFWQPAFAPATSFNDPNHTGFGIGIDPDLKGVNIYNESNLFHEALHGMTALYDGEGGLPTSLQIKAVLGICPTFR
jgi:hypothetical protein